MYPDDFENEHEKQIADKVDQLMEHDGGGLRDIDDGTVMQDGHMELSGGDVQATRKFTVSDSVFEEEPDDVYERPPGERTKESSDEDGLHVHVISRDEDGLKRKYYNYYSDEEPEGGTGRGFKAAVVICVVLMALALAALAFYFFIYIKNENTSEENTATEEETTAGYSDVITCGIEDGDICTTPISIVLESEEGNRIYYTLDGTDPDSDSDIFYEEIVIEADDFEDLTWEITLKAVSVASSGTVAGVFEINFTVEAAETEAPVFSIESGNYTKAQEIEITAGDDAVIYYTLDGTDPTEDSELYKEAIEMYRGSCVLKAIAVKDGRVSEITTAVYNYTPETITYSEALSCVKSYLISAGTISDTDGNTGDGGRAVFGSAGEIQEDTAYYYIIVVDTYDSSGALTGTDYLGVDDVDGSVYGITYDGFDYTLGSALSEED